MLRVIIIVNCYYKKLFFKCTQLSAVGGYLTLWKKKQKKQCILTTVYKFLCVLLSAENRMASVNDNRLKKHRHFFSNKSWSQTVNRVTNGHDFLYKLDRRLGLFFLLRGGGPIWDSFY